MSCGCENRRKAGEIGRMRRLAKSTAVLTGRLTVLYLRENGTYGVAGADESIEGTIIEYLTPY